MFTLAWRNLRKERVRLVVSAAGVAFAVLLIVLLRGVFVAYQSKIADYYKGVGADAWMVQQGTPTSCTPSRSSRVTSGRRSPPFPA